MAKVHIGSAWANAKRVLRNAAAAPPLQHLYSERVVPEALIEILKFNRISKAERPREVRKQNAVLSKPWAAGRCMPENTGRTKRGVMRECHRCIHIKYLPVTPPVLPRNPHAARHLRAVAEIVS